MNKNRLKGGDLIEFADGSTLIIGIKKNGDGLTIKEIERLYDVKIKKVARPSNYIKIYEKNEILDNTGVPIINPHYEEELKQARKEKAQRIYFGKK